MFSLVWRFFPGPWWLRVAVILALLAALVYAMMFYVYPWAAPYIESLQEENSTVGG